MSLSRSEQMARIRSHNTRPEVLLRSALWKAGLRFRLVSIKPVARPDIVFAKQRLAIFIDGCFWHGCPVHYLRPRTSEAYWAAKLSLNVERDRRQTRILERLGWRVFRVWEHDVFERLDAVLSGILTAIREKVCQRGHAWRVYRVSSIAGSECLEQRYLCTLRDPRLTKTTTGPRGIRMWSRAGQGRRKTRDRPAAPIKRRA